MQSLIRYKRRECTLTYFYIENSYEIDGVCYKRQVFASELDREGNPYPESRLTFEARLRVLTDGGELVLGEEVIEVIHAKSATLSLVDATSFVIYYKRLESGTFELPQRKNGGKSIVVLTRKYTGTTHQ